MLKCLGGQTFVIIPDVHGSPVSDKYYKIPHKNNLGIDASVWDVRCDPSPMQLF